MANSITYPVDHPSGTLTTDEIHLLLKNPRLIAKRVQTLADMRYVADFLLQGRYNAQGGGIFYENGEPIADLADPEAVAPGGEYPLSIIGRGDLAAAKTTKWGRDAEVYDEAISRLGINPLDRAILKLVNANIRYIDTVALAVIASKVTGTVAAAGTWAGTDADAAVGNIIETVSAAQAAEEDLELGIERDTVVLSTTAYAKVLGRFVRSGALPREEGNALLNGQRILNQPLNLLGFTWVRTSHLLGTDPYLIDREQLGGMADEDLGSPGYVRGGTNRTGVETKVFRLGSGGDDDRDGYRLRARRVTVPVVVEPLAGVRITGTSL